MRKLGQTSSLTVALCTFNRLPLLKKCLRSLLTGVSQKQIKVLDAGSTDDTVEFIKKRYKQIRIIQYPKIGQAKSLNRFFKTVRSKYACWISDDNIIKHGMLKKAENILDQNPKIGMVGLKAKDVTGPYRDEEYIGGISPAGILNINQGMFRMDIACKIGFFDEKFPDYGMDVDLTTQILLAGYKVVYTKDIAILHYRDYGKYPGAFELEDRKKRSLLSHKIYLHKYQALCKEYEKTTLLYYRIYLLLRSIVAIPFQLIYSFLSIPLSKTRLIFLLLNARKRVIDLKNNSIGTKRDWNNILRGRFISYLDLWYNRNRDFYFVQKIKTND